MTPEEAKDAIAAKISVTRPDIVAAKTYLIGLGNGLISIKPQNLEWARIVSPGTPQVLALDSEDVGDQLTKASRFLSARLALCAAAWELVRIGLFFQAGQSDSEDVGWGWSTRGYRASFSFENRYPLIYPAGIWRPQWHDRPSDLCDADLYLQGLSSQTLNPHVDQALRLSLDCFRHELWIPCVAMLGSASEATWIEMGTALARHFSQQSEAGKLHHTLANSQASTKEKIASTCRFYELQACKPVHQTAGVTPKRLREIQQWSDQIRESRNVLHWGAIPSVPNSYEKVAVLLMDAVSELTDLRRIHNAVI